MKRIFIEKACMILACLLLCGGAGSPGAMGEAPDAIDGLIAGMSTRDKLAQMMFISPRYWKDDTAPEAPPRAFAS